MVSAGVFSVDVVSGDVFPPGTLWDGAFSLGAVWAGGSGGATRANTAEGDICDMSGDMGAANGSVNGSI